MTTKETATPRNLHTKLVQLRAELNPQIKKGAVNDRLQYSFVEATTVGRLMIEGLTKYGLTMLPISLSRGETRESISGKQWVDTVEMLWRITDADTGEYIDVVSAGQGADQADKSIPKALTNAMKYAILLVLQAVGDDPEGDGQTDELESPRSTNRPSSAPRETGRGRGTARPEATAAADPQLAPTPLKNKIRSMAREVGLDDAGLKALAFNATGKESSKEWSVRDAEKVISRLERPEIVETFRDLKEVAE